MDTEIESMSLGGIEESRRSSFHGSHSGGSVRRVPSYHKSMSAPSSRPRTPPPELAIPPTIIGELILLYSLVVHLTSVMKCTMGTFILYQPPSLVL